MSLQFYFGPAGSGKSTKLNQDLIKWSLAEPDKRFFLIVPDQFSLHTQMELVKTHPQRGIMNIEVLSFGRLAHRIFSEVGRSRLTVLDEVGKSLIIRKIAGDIANDLPTIGKSLGKLGLVNEVKSVVSELMQYGITPTDLQMMIKHSAKRGALASKLAEIQRLYAAFLKYIADRYITGEETLDLLCAALPKSGLVKGSVVVFDGFTGFTPLQNRVIQEWMRLAERVVVSVLMGAEAVPDEEAQKEQSLFYLTAKMVQDLSRLAQEAGVARLADIYMREAFRWSEGSALAHLEKHLFRYPWQAYDGEVQDDTLVNTSLRGDELKEHVLSTRRRSNPDKPKIVSVSGLLRYARNDGIKVSESPSLLAEAREACQKIKELTSEEGLAYREIAIITGDMENYAPYLEREALKYDIPLYLDRTRGILLNPFTEYIRAALAVVSNNYDYDGVFHFLRSGFAEVAAGEGGFETRPYTGVMAESKKGALTVDEIDRLENYVIACGIRGKKQWHEPFTRRQPSWRGEEEIKEQLLSLNQTREKVVAAMFVPPVHGRPRTVAPTSDTTDSESTVGAVVNRPPTEPTVGATVPGRPPTADGQATEPTVGAVVNRPPTPPTPAAIIESLYAFLVSSRVQQKLAAYEAAFTASGDLVKAKEYAQIFRLVMELLEQIHSLLGAEEMSLKEFAEILDAGLAEIRVGTIPQNVDRVVVGDMERTRLTQVRALFFLGVNEGNIPSSGKGGGLISDLDREFLRESAWELAPTPRQRMYIQRLYLYMNMTKPAERLYLSYARVDGEGKTLRPSYLIDALRKLFPALTVGVARERADLARVYGIADSWDVFTERLRKFASGEERAVNNRPYEDDDNGDKDRGDGNVNNVCYPNCSSRGDDLTDIVLLTILGNIYQQNPRDKQTMESLINQAFHCYSHRRLTKSVAELLYGVSLTNSVSRLEKYALCPYAHFLQYGLTLRERDEYIFAAVDLGNVYHKVLEIFAQKLAERNIAWSEFSQSEGEALLREAIASYTESHSELALFGSARDRQALARVSRILSRTIATLQWQLAQGDFRPERFEAAFVRGEGLFWLQGRIDRIDLCETEGEVLVKVVDYKSGLKRFDLAALCHGLQLQLLAYLGAALEMTKESHPEKDVRPAAALYYHVFDPLVSAGEAASEDELADGLLGEQRMTGVVSGGAGVIERLDRGFTAKSRVIPVGRKKDGGFTSGSDILSNDDFMVAVNYVNHMLGAMGREIMAGAIEASPCEYRGGSGCAYCGFRHVCGFDPRLPGYRVRRLPELSDGEALALMRETARTEL